MHTEGQAKYGQIARRYAAALFDLALEEKQLEETAKELAGLQSLFSQNDELAQTMTSPVYSRQDKVAAMEALTNQAKASKIATNFIKLLTQNDRMAAFPTAVAAFERMVQDHNNVVTAHIKSARVLSSDQRKSLNKELEKKTGKKVNMEIEVDPDLIAGLTVMIGSDLYDASLKAKINRLSQELKKPNLN